MRSSTIRCMNGMKMVAVHAFFDWLIFSDYESANAYVRNRLIEIDNPAVSFSIVPLDVDNAERVELIV